MDDFKRRIIAYRDGKHDYKVISTKSTQIAIEYHFALKKLEVMLPEFSKKEKLDSSVVNETSKPYIAPPKISIH